MGKYRARRSVEEWQDLIAEQRLMGETHTEFCKSHGINLGSFQNALKRLSVSGEFLDLTPSVPTSKGWESELTFPNGIVVRIRSL